MTRGLLRVGCVVVALAAAAALRWWWVYQAVPLTGVDDANIPFTYARHLSEGHGPVYRLGGPPVEGFTSALWVGLLTLSALALPAPIEWAAVALGLLASAVAVERMLAVVASAEAGWPLAGGCLLALLLIPDWIDWCALSLLDTGLWGGMLCLCAALVALPRESAGGWPLAAALAALCWTRPEAMLLGPLLGVVWAAHARAGGRGWAAALLPLGAFAAAQLALIGWRLWTFGWPLPNTYYAKVSADRLANLQAGWAYLLAWFGERPLLGALALLAVAGGLRSWRAPARLALPGLALATLLVPLVTGGDHFAGHRFFQPALPMLIAGGALTLAELLGWARARGRAAQAAVLLPLLVLTGLSWRSQPWREPVLAGEMELAHRTRMAGELLNRMFDPAHRPSYGTVVTGGAGFAYRGPVIDLMGLNEPQMAHARAVKQGPKNHGSFDPEVFYTLAPDVLEIHELPFVGRPPEPCPPGSISDRALRGIVRTPRFRAAYQLVVIADARSGSLMGCLARRAWLRSLPRERYRVFAFEQG